MKLNLLTGILLIAAFVHQGESSITRDAIEKALGEINTLGGQVVNAANDYFTEKLKNETQIQKWSVDIQVNVFAGIANLIFSGFDVLKNASIIDDKLLNCMVDEEPNILAALKQAASDNGWCNNKLAANLTRAFQGVTKLMVERNVEFKGYLDSFSSCDSGDDTCFTQYLTKVVEYIKSEFGEGNTMLAAVQEVIRVYTIMFGTDVPACNEKYLFPEIADGIHNAFVNIHDCSFS